MADTCHTHLTRPGGACGQIMHSYDEQDIVDPVCYSLLQPATHLDGVAGPACLLQPATARATTHLDDVWACCWLPLMILLRHC